MERDYIKIPKTSSLSDSVVELKQMNDEFWKNEIFKHILLFYKTYNLELIKNKILKEKSKKNPRIERLIARYMRSSLNKNIDFNYHFKATGEETNDEEIEGNYDISIVCTIWKSQNFYFECKNLDKRQDLVNKYVFYNRGNKDFDGGVYRFFNGKYAQQQNFGGMIGFVLDGDILKIKNKIFKKLKDKFDVTPEGDLKQIVDCSIEGNEFTFDSVHHRNETEFLLHHLLLNFSF